MTTSILLNTKTTNLIFFCLIIIGLLFNRVTLTSWGEGAILALGGHLSRDGVTKKYLMGWMFCNIHQRCTPYFPIRFVKTESESSICYG